MLMARQTERGGSFRPADGAVARSGGAPVVVVVVVAFVMVVAFVLGAGGCASGPPRAATNDDPWLARYDSSPATVDAGKPVEVAGSELALVSKPLREEAVRMLEARDVVPIDEPTAARLTGARRDATVTPGLRPYLVRLLCLGECFPDYVHHAHPEIRVSLHAGKLAIEHRTLGHAPRALVRWGLVVWLPEAPAGVSLRVSMIG